MWIANFIRKRHKKYEVVFAGMNIFHMPPPASSQGFDLSRRDDAIVDDDDIDIVTLTQRECRICTESVKGRENKKFGGKIESRRIHSPSTGSDDRFLLP